MSIISQGDLLVKHFFQKNKKRAGKIIPALSPQKSSLENRNTEKDKSKAIRRPPLKTARLCRTPERCKRRECMGFRRRASRAE